MNANELNIIFNIDDRQVVEKERIIRQTLRNLIEQDKEYAAYEKQQAQDLTNAEKQKADKIRQINQQEVNDRKQAIASLQRSLTQQHDEYVRIENQKREEIRRIAKQEAEDKKQAEREYQSFLKSEKEKEKQLAKANADFQRQQNQVTSRDASRLHEERQRMYNNLFGAQKTNPFDSINNSISLAESKLTSFITTGLGIGSVVVLAEKVGEAFKEAYHWIQEGAKHSMLEESFRGTEKDYEMLYEASGGLKSKVDFVTIANRNLGLSFKEQAAVIGIARLGIRKFGGDLNDAYMKAINVTEGMVRGTKDLNIEKAKYNRLVEDGVKQYGGLIEYEKQANGEQEINIKGLDPRIQKQIRLNALIGASGYSLEQLTHLEQNAYEKTVAFDNAVEDIGDDFKKAFSKSVLDAVADYDKSLQDAGIQLSKTKSASSELATEVGHRLLPSLNNLLMLNPLTMPFGFMAKFFDTVTIAVVKFGNSVQDTINDAWNALFKFDKTPQQKQIDKDFEDRSPIKGLVKERIDYITTHKKEIDEILNPIDNRKKEPKEKVSHSPKQKQEEISEENVLIKQIEQKILLNKNLNNYAREQIELDKQKLLTLANAIDSNSTDTKLLEKKNNLLETYNKLIKEFGSAPKTLAISETQRTKETELVSSIIPESRDLPDYAFEQWDTKRKIEEQERKKQEESALKVVDTMSQGVGVAQQLSDVLGFGADSFVGKFLNGLQQGLSLANSFASFLSMIFNIGSGGAGGLFSLIGLADGTDNWPGGWAMMGDDRGKPTRYSEAAYLAPGSKVFSNKQTMGLRDLFKFKTLSDGTIPKMDFNRYAGAGSGSGFQPDITVIVQSELEKHKITKVFYNENINSGIYANKKVLG